MATKNYIHSFILADFLGLGNSHEYVNIRDLVIIV